MEDVTETTATMQDDQPVEETHLDSIPHKRPDNPSGDVADCQTSPTKKQKLDNENNNDKDNQKKEKKKKKVVVEEKPWNICDGGCKGCLEFVGETHKKCMNCGCFLINHIPSSLDDFPIQDQDEDYLPAYGNEEEAWY